MTTEEQEKILELEAVLPPGAYSSYDLYVLVPEVEKLKPDDIFVEIGTGKGKSFIASYLSAKRGVELYTIDIENLPERKENFEEHKIPEKCFIHKNNREVAKQWDKGKVSLIHIDGDHTYEGVKADIESWLPLMKKNGVMLFHDCDESSVGVMRAVTEFVNTHVVNKFEMFKTKWNTSMAKICL